MNKDYRTIADKILEERDVYYKKRTKAVKTALYSLIPLFIISISFLFWPKPSGSSQPPKNYLYVEMTVEKSTVDGFSVVKISNVETIEEIMDFSKEKDQSSTPSAPENDSSAGMDNNSTFFEENTDYFITATDKNGNTEIVVITREYIITSSKKVVSISREDYSRIQDILS